MAGNILPKAELTTSGRPVLHPGEVESSLLSSVDLLSEQEHNPASFPHLKSGLLILTNHRLLWLPESATASASAVAIPLAAVVHISSSSKKSIKTMFASPRVRFRVSTTPQGRVDPGGSQSVPVTLVLRGKSTDPDSFLGRFFEAWRGMAWEAPGGSGSGAGTSGPGDGLRTPVVGVAGILRKEQEMWESTDKSLQDAFQDLNALMSKAKEMVMLAEKMRLKLLSGSNNQTGAANDEEMGSKEEMQDWLLSVGIVSPVTKESAGALYHQQLSRQPSSSPFSEEPSPVVPKESSPHVSPLLRRSQRDRHAPAYLQDYEVGDDYDPNDDNEEDVAYYALFADCDPVMFEEAANDDYLWIHHSSLIGKLQSEFCDTSKLADFVKIPIERAGGMINLIDIYCVFNRARGTELISPDDLLQACTLWEKLDVPVMLRKFDSGVMVIQNKSHSDDEVFARIKYLVLKPDALRSGVSASDAAMTLGIAPAMAKEHLLTAESKGMLLDVSPDGFRFYINLFQEIDPHDVYLVKDRGIYSAWCGAVSASRLVAQEVSEFRP
ncbi:hypothetical protein RJ639_009094 [Escallonia herrerae]|uniref:Vacuolar protein-sorting-associated protein 36 n=1 Tax=Escallonia herrerae TaxID=1293975 RepID=A0AA88VSX2_9ASTE|nr:hypothetical protein RJ639_009094 [Escallonia herrerae]